MKCHNTTDGSGDAIVDLPPDLLAKFGLSLGDELTGEVIDGAIVLTPKSNTTTSA
ncbi:AbrB/MazE/SpoVT family DNA-binding domain-containing protein [Pseudomonas frederiksbergensis]|uniref:AbrB/MazE/SpoVT family DNA-binding domain-containing protein n=1 Tax=Pseudomonas frederiksbergensis TaxID=104087 RepID=UPI002E800143|nr:AbrB/MazE/SpoVT family DNA-binding domain-containing protein [Pseudomonas frederiksbergensis]